MSSVHTGSRILRQTITTTSSRPRRPRKRPSTRNQARHHAQPHRSITARISRTSSRSPHACQTSNHNPHRDPMHPRRTVTSRRRNPHTQHTNISTEVRRRQRRPGAGPRGRRHTNRSRRIGRAYRNTNQRPNALPLGNTHCQQRNRLRRTHQISASLALTRLTRTNRIRPPS